MNEAATDTSPARGDSTFRYRVEAYNYSTDSDNKIHEDATAKKFGFAGGLVPGISDYAYMSRPAFDALGLEWLDRGWMKAKFFSPIYDGDLIEARALRRNDDSGSLTLELANSAGEVCAVGAAGLRRPEDFFDPIDWRELGDGGLPAFDQRPAACLERLCVGRPLGRLLLDETRLEELRLDLLERFRATDFFAVHNGGESVDKRLHPAVVPDLGNQILVENVELGPWIHTASEVVHHRPLTTQGPLEVRARVVRSGLHKGHEIVELDVALVVGQELAAELRHTAIIRPRQLHETD